MSSNQFNSNTTPQYAGFGRRLLAYFVDFGLVFIIGIVVQTMLGQNPFTSLMKAQSVEELQQLQTTTSQSLPTLISLAFGLIYFLLFWVNYDGATPGKRLMAIKITKDDGSKITYPIAFIRYLGMFVSAISLGLGYLWVIWDKRKQAWHDKIAKTIVVKTNAKPKTALAIFLSILVIIIFSVFMGAGMYRGYELGMQGVEQKKIDTQPARSLKEHKEGMSAEAKVHWDKAQELFKQVHANINDVNKLKPLADEAIQELTKATEIEPDNPVIWAELKNAYTWPNNIGDRENALDAARKAEELDPTNVVYINEVGDELIALGRYEEAILQFQKTLRLTNTSGYAHLSIGIAYKNLGIYDSAREHLQKAVDVFTPQNDKGQFDDEILQARKEMAGLPQ